eukprot:COSAG02_NODE_100_length_36897_cov_9.681749_31_plen_93_part_00
MSTTVIRTHHCSCFFLCHEALPLFWFSLQLAMCWCRAERACWNLHASDDLLARREGTAHPPHYRIKFALSSFSRHCIAGRMAETGKGSFVID